MKKRSKFIEFLFPDRCLTQNFKERTQKESRKLRNQVYYWNHIDEIRKKRKERYDLTGE